MKEKRKNAERKLEGIKGWLIIPAIGLVLTLLLTLSTIIIEPNFFSLGYITFLIITIYFFFNKKKEARVAMIVLYSLEILFLNLPAIIWLIYFIRSKRVKNTFIN